jgi:hypothetical protein
MSNLSTLDRARTDRAPADRAARIQRPSWRDSRLLVGVLLVLASIALGSYLVARADDSVPMFAASGPLTPGQSLTESAVVRVDVRLADGVAGYLSADEPLPADRVLLRDVRPGELVPLSAIGTADEAGLSQVTISVDATSAAALTTGTVVDVFVNLPVPGSVREEYSGPERLLERVTVAAVDTTGGGLGSAGGSTAVRVMVPVAQVPDLVAAIDLQAKVTVVPVPGAVTRSGG